MLISLLQNAENYANLNDIARYVAEAKFFRAYEYFDLLQLFGDAIIVTKPVDIDAAEMNAARNDRSEVADLIIRDLQEAILICREKVRFLLPIKGVFLKVRLKHFCRVWHCMKGLGRSSDRAT